MWKINVATGVEKEIFLLIFVTIWPEFQLFALGLQSPIFLKTNDSSVSTLIDISILDVKSL